MGVELSGCAQCSKYLLIVFNVIFFLAGIALLAVGIWVVVEPYQIEILNILDNPLIQNGAYLIIALGAFIVIVSALGCCGACMQSKCLLVVYFIIVLIIFIAQLVGCALVLAFRDEVDTFLTDNLSGTMDEYKGENATDVSSTGWNAMQILFECCGTNGYEDWANTTWVEGNPTYNGRQQTFPLTCCVYDNKNDLLTGTDWPAPADMEACLNASSGVTTPSNVVVNTKGCYNSIEDFILTQIYYVGGVGIGVIVFELFAMIFAIALCRGIGEASGVV